MIHKCMLIVQKENLHTNISKTRHMYLYTLMLRVVDDYRKCLKYSLMRGLQKIVRDSLLGPYFRFN